MARSAKAGPARSRRRPDPSSRYNLGQLVTPVQQVTDGSGAGVASITVIYADPTTGQGYLGSQLQETGEATTVRLVNIAGDVFTPTIAIDPTAGEVTYEASGLVADSYAFVSNGLDPAVRYANYGWTGTLYQAVTVT